MINNIRTNKNVHCVYLFISVILVHGHLMSSEGITYGATNQNATVLGGLFASVLGSDGRQGPAPSRLALLCSLLNLSRKLAQTPLVSPPQVSCAPYNDHST